MFNVVLVEPEIPPNTGSVARLCLATGSILHLVKPLGFSIEDRYLRRAGMDYWPRVRLHYWESLAQFLEGTASAKGRYFLTTKATRRYWETRYQPEDFLVFGRETKGLPETLLQAQHAHCFTIPMHPEVRSLNLATAVAIVLFEAVRQTQICDF